jgi:hypothetical protein
VNREDWGALVLLQLAEALEVVSGPAGEHCWEGLPRMHSMNRETGARW